MMDERNEGTTKAYHWGCAEAEDDGARDEGVERGVELGRDVGRVGELADDDGPLALEGLDEDRGEEHAGEDESSVDGGQGSRSQPGFRVDGTLRQFHHQVCANVED